jgi:stage III sporulation protein AH
MLLKKQTVWLLTMLSLIIVLSVYYITSPTQSPTDLAYVESDGEETAAEQDKDGETAKEDGEDGAAVSSIANDQMFIALRMEIDEAREKMHSKYTEVIASENAAPELQAEAMAKMEKLNELSMREATLETLIASMGFEDVLVNTMDEVVQVIVKTENEISKKEVNDIMVKTMEELGTGKQVSVKHYAMNK